MAERGALRARPLGATARLGRSGFPHITSATGGALAIATGASEAGFNPIDLLYASLAACMVMSARIAAKRLDLLDRIESLAVSVSGEKERDGEGERVARFAVSLDITGGLDAAQATHILHLAEEICTVSRTLQGTVSLTATASLAPPLS